MKRALISIAITHDLVELQADEETILTPPVSTRKRMHADRWHIAVLRGPRGMAIRQPVPGTIWIYLAQDLCP